MTLLKAKGEGQGCQGRPVLEGLAKSSSDAASCASRLSSLSSCLRRKSPGRDSTNSADTLDAFRGGLSQRATIPYPPGRLGDAQSVARTVVAFLSLARCTRAIVAPVDSQFSATAALAARVPLAGCCTEVENAVAEFERVAELKDSTHHLASGRGAKIGARREFRARGMSAARGVTRAAAH